MDQNLKLDAVQFLKVSLANMRSCSIPSSYADHEDLLVSLKTLQGQIEILQSFVNALKAHE